MKIRFHKIDRKNTNDCWNVALALGLHVSYEELRKILLPLANDDGGMNLRLWTGFLASKGWWRIDHEGEAVTVRKAVELYNSYDNDMIIASDAHAFYVSNRTIFDDIEIEERNNFLNKDVIYVIMKEKPNGSNLRGGSPVEKATDETARK